MDLNLLPHHTADALYKVLMTMTEDNIDSAKLNHFERDAFMVGLDQLKEISSANLSSKEQQDGEQKKN